MFFKKDDGNGLKMQCALAKKQIDIVMNKKKTMYNTTRRKIADHLRQGIASSNFSMAEVQVESIVIDHRRFEAVARIQISLELLTQKCIILAQAKQMPTDMYGSICTVIFASSQLAEYDGLQEVSKLLINKFSKHHGGKDFVRQVTSGDSIYISEWRINLEVATCLSTKPPSAEEKKRHLQQIAADYNITLDETMLDAKLNIVARAPPPPSPPLAVPTSNTRGRGTGGGGVAAAAPQTAAPSYGCAPVQHEPTFRTRSSAPRPQAAAGPRPSQPTPPSPPKQTTTTNTKNQQNGSETARTAGSTSNTPSPVKPRLQQLDSGIALKIANAKNWNDRMHSGSISSGSSAAPSRMQSGGSALAEEKGGEEEGGVGRDEQPPPGLQEEDSVSTPFLVPPAGPVSTLVVEEEEEEFNPPLPQGVLSSTVEVEQQEENAPPSPPPVESPPKPSTTVEEVEVGIEKEEEIPVQPSVEPPQVPSTSPPVPAASVDSTSVVVPIPPQPSSVQEEESQVEVVDAPVEEQDEKNEEDELQKLFARLKSKDLGP